MPTLLIYLAIAVVFSFAIRRIVAGAYSAGRISGRTAGILIGLRWGVIVLGYPVLTGADLPLILLLIGVVASVVVLDAWLLPLMLDDSPSTRH
jgi:hypothetical protein